MADDFEKEIQKDLKLTSTMAVLITVFVMLMIIAVVGTGIYLAIHNWG